MTEFPSALDLEFLSDNDLSDKIAEIITIIDEKKSTQEDDRDEQEFLEELEAEQVRRQMKPSAKTFNFESFDVDEDDEA